MSRIHQFACGKIEMTAAQVRAADVYLKKVIPDMARTELTGKDGAAIETKDITKTDAEILAQYINKGATK